MKYNTATQERIAWLMWRENLTAIDFAKRTGMANAQLSMIMRGHVRPSPGTLKKIAKAYRVSTEWLTGAGSVEDAYTA